MADWRTYPTPTGNQDDSEGLILAGWFDEDLIAAATGNNYVLTAQAGSYVLSGQTATLARSKVITASAGSYALTGQNAVLTYTPFLRGTRSRPWPGRIRLPAKPLRWPAAN